MMKYDLKIKGENPPSIVTSRCVGCGACQSVCPCNPSVFEIINDVSNVIHPEICVDCGMCEQICPIDAVVKKR